MDIQQATNYPVGTIIRRESDRSHRIYRIGNKVLESLVGDGSWIAFAMRIDDLRGDDWVIKEE